MIRIAICDDEQRLRKELRKVVERSLQLKGRDYQLQEFDCGEALLAELSAGSIDILFLDIEMGQLNGMDTARLLRKQAPETLLIFVTSHPDYVFQGYEVKALNYILKPYKEQKILEVLDAAIAELSEEPEQSFLVKHKGGQKRLLVQNICYFWSERRKIHVRTEEEVLTFYGKLNEIELEMPDCFVRIHNRYLVNINFVQETGTEYVSCAGQSLPLSRGNKQDLHVAFAKLLLE
ncbi:response regulator transcription factor [Enterococcus sp. 669A]|uniref:Response regulator transcription factor n=1 Tax=Candidatus Enterococcus moelleringii TaxID=2815325 RepID=A0ABS3L6R3_9ENTE|nr:LytTR family DNA-binding domain-containing protein [Enterococcus sp. 669A]MBO1305285.1 response regulator transcription factor [Enterococcus sp. 669A]